MNDNPDIFSEWVPPQAKFYMSWHPNTNDTGVIEFGVRMELTDGKPAITLNVGFGAFCLGWFYG